MNEHEFLNQDRFFLDLDNGVVEWMYYNPDAVSGGQFVVNLFSVDDITDALAETMDEMSVAFYTDSEKEVVARLFPTCEKISIDYAVMEKADCIYTLPASFGWSDLGTWGSLRNLMPQDQDGNAVVGESVRLEGTKGCVVHTPGLSKVVVQGLEGYIVAQHGDRLLVCRLDDEQNITRYVSQ